MHRALSLLLLSVISIGVLGVAVGSDRAEACGPGFPPSLLSQREQALTAALDEPFAALTRQMADGLVPADPPFVVVSNEPDGVRDRGGDEERRLYDDGARRFHAGDGEGAARAFRALLALPEEARRHRSTWAAFMLGRLGETARFAEVRSLTAAGFIDELGLAVASFGAEARRYLSIGSNVIIDGVPGIVLDGLPAVAADDALALLLYARQARYGVDGGISLLHLARQIVDGGGARLELVANTPIGQRLLATYAATRADERPINTNAALDVLVKHDDCAWPEQLAAALYKQGRMDDARRFVAKAPTTPTGLWVRARLAMRAGNLDEANTLLAAASAAFPTVPVRAAPVEVEDEEPQAFWYYEGGDVVSGQRRLSAERGVLALARGEYVFALERFLEQDLWWRDAAHVAERVLQVDELKQFVLTHPRLATPTTTTNRPNLRAVLARRLVREGRLDEAIGFFDDPEIAAHARRLQSLRNGTAPDLAALPDDVRRAARLFEQAELIHRFGLELQGTELGPDWSLFGGWYEADDDGSSWDDDGNRTPPKPQTTTVLTLDEQQRIAASAPVPSRRFHYRAVAVALAEQAAALVPTRSRAWAAIICKASGYANGDDVEVQRLWQLYVKNGAVVDFTAAFGSTRSACPAPDFERLAEQQRQQREQRLRRIGTVVAVAAIVAVIIVITVLGVRRRRRSSSAR